MKVLHFFQYISYVSTKKNDQTIFFPFRRTRVPNSTTGRRISYSASSLLYLRCVLSTRLQTSPWTQPWWRLPWVPKSTSCQDCERPEITFLPTLQGLPRIFKAAQLLGDVISWDQRFALAVWSHSNSADGGSEVLGAVLTDRRSRKSHKGWARVQLCTSATSKCNSAFVTLITVRITGISGASTIARNCPRLLSWIDCSLTLRIRLSGRWDWLLSLFCKWGHQGTEPVRN